MMNHMKQEITKKNANMRIFLRIVEFTHYYVSDNQNNCPTHSKNIIYVHYYTYLSINVIFTYLLPSSGMEFFSTNLTKNTHPEARAF